MKRIVKLLVACFMSLFLFTPVFAASDVFITDESGVLTDDQIAELNTKAQEISDSYQVGVYVRMIDTTDGTNVETYAENIYKSESLGYGSENNGILLLLAVQDRKYDICAFGDTANTTFTDYAKGQIGDDLKAELSNDDWYQGLVAYLNGADYSLDQAINQGTPVDTWIPDDGEEMDPGTVAIIKYAIMIGIPALLALIICSALKAKNKTEHVALEAHDYVPQGGVNITNQRDQFINTTVIRVPIHHDDDNGGHMGGTSINSGGFSHSSGSF